MFYFARQQSVSHLDELFGICRDTRSPSIQFFPTAAISSYGNFLEASTTSSEMKIVKDLKLNGTGKITLKNSNNGIIIIKQIDR